MALRSQASLMVLAALFANSLPGSASAHPTPHTLTDVGAPRGVSQGYGATGSDAVVPDPAATPSASDAARSAAGSSRWSADSHAGESAALTGVAQTPFGSEGNFALNDAGAGVALGMGLRPTFTEPGRDPLSAATPIAPEIAAPPGRDSAPRPGDEILAAFAQLQVSLTETVAEALDPRVDRDGTVSFALAGIEGFRLAQSTGTLTLGYGDDSLQLVQYAGSRERQFDPGAARGLPPDSAPPPFNALRELFEFLKDIAQYPLAWVLVLFLMIGKFAISIAERRSRQPRHARHAKSQTGIREPRRSRSRHKQRLHSSLPAQAQAQAQASRHESRPIATADCATR